MRIEILWFLKTDKFTFIDWFVFQVGNFILRIDSKKWLDCKFENNISLQIGNKIWEKGWGND